MKLKKILKKLESQEKFPVLKCPFCDEGNLKITDSNKICFTNVKSQKHYDIVGEPTVLIGEFAYELLCDNTECGEKGIVVGKTDTIENGYDDGIDNETGDVLHSGFETYKRKYRIEYITIPINLITIPESIDKDLEMNIQSSYNLFWTDLNSCGNRLRTVVELLLDKIGQPQEKKLNTRIENLKKDTSNKYNNFAEKFDVIRLLGNESTHNFATIDKNDVIKLYEVIEYCIGEIYSTKHDDIELLTTELKNKFK